MSGANEDILHLARLVQHLRQGLVHEIGGPASGNVSWGATGLRIGRPTGDSDHALELQVRLEIRTPAGRTARSAWTRCTWTIEELRRTHRDAVHEEAISTGMDDVDGSDAMASEIGELREGGSIRLGEHVYMLDDGSFSVKEKGSLLKPDHSRQPASGWIIEGLDPGMQAVSEE